MRRLILASALLSFFSGTWIPEARADAFCDRLLPPPTTHVEPFGAEVRLRRSLPSAALSGQQPMKRGSHTLGLTSTTMYHDFILEWNVQTVRNVVCIRPAHINLRVGYQNRTVDIAAEIPDGTCIREEVMAHEMRHVNTGVDVVLRFVPDLSADLARIAKSAPSGSFDPRERAAMAAWTDRQKDWIEASLRGDMAALVAEHDRAQALIDTTEEYKRLGAVCGGEASRYIGGNPMYRRR